MSSSDAAGSKDLKADLVVIGGGGAGLAAAVSATENGAGKVIVLEKRSSPGGNTAMSLGPFGAESPVQKRAMIDCRRDDCFRIIAHYSHWKIDPRIVRAFLDKSGDTIRWLEAKGLRFECTPLYPNQLPITWHVVEGYGARLTRVLATECKKQGVELLTRTPAKRLLTGEKGQVVGVAAEREGKELTITAKAVIIATGGFGGNKELLKKYCPHQYHENMKCDGVPHTGDGLLMALEIGAATEGWGLLMMSGPQIPQSVSLRIGTPPDTFVVPLMALALEPNTLWVNKKGQRYVDETVSYHHFSYANAVNRQPGNVTYTLFDHRIVQSMAEDGLIIGLGRPSVQERTRMPGLEGELKKLAGGEHLRISDSWDGIADWIGADRKVLKATIDEYNAACDRGHDPVFTKEQKYLVPLRTAPYFALKGNSDFLDTIGGIKVNERMEVLDKQDVPIPGLYAAGVTVGGWQGDTYCDMLSGAASGFALNSGRIAAENAVRLIRAG